MIEHDTLLVTLVKLVGWVPRRPRRQGAAVAARRGIRTGCFCRPWSS